MKQNHSYQRQFFQRGLMFGGFGPIVTGIVYLILSYTLPEFSLSGTETFIAILSTYLLAFIQAGASVFHQIERWSAAKALLIHMLVLYAAYSGCYLLNAWIPFDPTVLLIFTAIFAGGYLVIWLSVFLSIKAVGRRFNQQLG